MNTTTNMRFGSKKIQNEGVDKVYIESLIVEQMGETNMYNEYNSMKINDLMQSTHDIFGIYTFQDVKKNNKFVHTPRRYNT